MSRVTLPDKIVAIGRSLGGVPHAFGGALALAYHAEPRATVDIDLNAFVPAESAVVVLGLLESLGVEITGAAEVAERDGQVRVWWDGTPVDLFLSYDPFHEAAARAVQEVSFAATTIRVLSAEHLTVCKVVFDRPRDWVDIDAIVAAGTALDAAEVLRWVGRIVGDTDPRYDRIGAVLTRRR